ncbi:hypothetical protein AVEN_165455-1 [Araneus ventricosus]|uniref:Uncharacterized protein n=1 Tax=Araneus ventricosus TaxID=182803 RepID=A0A4Y2HVH3_ARAVE|nr:hypothetical protein AVEN_165455-1 [Araneus ventricosus]
MPLSPIRHFEAIPDENSSLSDKNPFIGRSLCDPVSMKGLSMADDILLLGKAFSVNHLLESSIHPLKDKIKIKGVRKIRNQVLAFDCEDDSDVQKNLSSIQNQEELKKNITHA